MHVKKRNTRKYAPVGARPGTLVLDTNKEITDLELIRFSSDHFEQKNISLAELDKLNEELHLPQKKVNEIFWLNVSGLGNEQVLRKIQEIFRIHELTLADIVNVPQRPKIEEQEDYVLIISQMLWLKDPSTISNEQVSILFGKNFVITFQEDPGDVFDPVRDRLKKSKGTIRKSGSDYLAYALIDSIIDNYFPILESIGEILEDLESALISNPDKDTLKRIYNLKRQLLNIRRTIWPHREVFSAILRDEFQSIKKSTRVYIRDVYDHTIEIIDVIENYREIAAGFMDVYLSSVSNKLNDVMKVLTIISTIFMPLSFIAGVYGMNFENMPELKTTYGYPVLLTIMTLIGLGMILWFKKKGWFKI